MSLSICVPWRLDGAERSRAWQWVRARYEVLVPEAEVITADSDGPFCFAQAANRAVKESSGEVVFIASAEIACDADYLRRATEVARTNMVVPTEYHYLTEADSLALLEQDPSTDDLPIPSVTEWSGPGVGHFMLPRAAFDAVGGYDERHQGWGWEDQCLIAAVGTLWGPMQRIPGKALHFWHPRSPETTTNSPTAPEQMALTHRYLDAAGDPHAIHELIAER